MSEPKTYYIEVRASANGYTADDLADYLENGPLYCDDEGTAENATQEIAALRALLAAPTPKPAATRCNDPCPPTWTGHWRDWHKGHGCDVELRSTSPAPAAASEPVSDPYKLPEEAEEIIYSVADSDCRCGLFLDIGIRCDPCRARAFLASRGGAK